MYTIQEAQAQIYIVTGAQVETPTNVGTMTSSTLVMDVGRLRGWIVFLQVPLPSIKLWIRAGDSSDAAYYY